MCKYANEPSPGRRDYWLLIIVCIQRKLVLRLINLLNLLNFWNLSVPKPIFWTSKTSWNFWTFFKRRLGTGQETCASRDWEQGMKNREWWMLNETPWYVPLFHHQPKTRLPKSGKFLIEHWLSAIDFGSLLPTINLSYEGNLKPLNFKPPMLNDEF